MTEDRLDRQIDLALREMAGGEGPADLRRRILDRVGEPRRRVASRGVMLAAATIALAVTTAVVFRRPVAPPPATMSAHRSPRPATAPISPPPASAGSSPPTIARLAIPATGRPAGWPPAPGSLVADDVEADASEMEPIEVPPLAVPPMETQPWAIAPLRIEPMQIEPLAEPQP
jgi:hypothetical protein